MLSNGTPYGLIKDAIVVLNKDRIVWTGRAIDSPDRYHDAEQINLGGRLITPALIDCHTHVVFAGDRAREFEMRLNGASYEQVARAGGGIVSTVTATRAATQEALIAEALPRVDALIAEGVSMIEIKSGYGLSEEAELKMLRAARQIAQQRDIHITTTYLGAHAVPPEYAGREDAYIDDVCIPTLRLAHAQDLVDAVDAFCEGIAFQPSQVAQVLTPPAHWVCRSKFTPNNCQTWAAQKWQRTLAHSRRIISSILTPRGLQPWLRPAQLRSFCPERFIRCVKRKRPPSPPCETAQCRWLWPAIAIPVPHP